MALNADNVMRGVTGVVSAAPSGTTLPTAVNSALNVAFDDLGWVSEDGITRSMPGTGDREVIRGWQNNGSVMTIRTPNDENPTWGFTLLESKLEVVEFALGVTVTQSATDGKWTVDADALRTNLVMVFDVVHGSRLKRQVLPQAVVTEVGDQVFAFGEPIGWEVTVEAERHQATGGHFIEFDSALKTP